MTSSRNAKLEVPQTVSANRARAWRDQAAVIATLLIILIGSLYGPLRFSLATGGLNWFQQAWDEPFYLANIFDLPFRLSQRSASDLPGYFLLALGVRNPFWFALAYDLVFPPAVFVMAYFVSKHLATQAIARLAWAIAIVFSFELLGFSSSLVFAAPPMGVFANTIGPNWLFAADVLPYFNLYRTPEPQVSWVVLLSYLYLLLRYCDRQEHKIYQILCCLNPFLCVVHINIAITLLLVYTMVSIGLALYFRWPIAIWFVGSLGATTVAFLIVLAAASSQLFAAQTVFASHLPVLRPSILYSVCGLAVLAIQVKGGHWVLTPRDLVCGCLFVIPLATLNQQVLTGHAVFAQNWEHYVNYICVMVGGGLLLTRPIEDNRSHVTQFLAAAVWLGLLVMIARGHVENVNQFARVNAVSLAQARAYAEAVTKVGPIERVVTPHLFDDSLFLTRVPASVAALGSYNWLSWNGPPAMKGGETIAMHLERSSAVAAIGFEVLARRGTTAQELQTELNQEISRGECWPVLVYFFAYIDCWSRLSNYRSKLMHDPDVFIEPIVARYIDYLREIPQTPSEPTLVLTSQARKADFAIPFQERLVTEVTVHFAGQISSAYLYLQTSPE